jgi:Reverse transcriptase (RNA-dependent DNA polymerase)
MQRTSSLLDISTRQEKIAQLAREAPGMVLTTLAHHIDEEWMKEAYRRTRKDGVLMVLEPIYEQDFLDCSYGFRPGRGAHRAIEVLWQQLSDIGGGWVIDLDIQRFFDTVQWSHLRNFLDQRVRDGVIRRAIGKWLNAGVMEAGELRYPEEGTPQGGVISPLLSNLYLHEVLDTWFAGVVKPRLQGRVFLVRYADDSADRLPSTGPTQTAAGSP